MRAWRLHNPGGPAALQLEELSRPEPKPGQVLIAVKAFGLNRSEWFTRNGDSPSVRLPRVLGIECAGLVAFAPGGEFSPGQKVFAMMGGMGREFDGSYAEFACVPASCVFAVESNLRWEELGALPEMLQTCHGSLHTGLGVVTGETLLIRGGTSSIGLTALSMAKAQGLRVATTTRSEAKRGMLLEAGAEEVFLETAKLSEDVRRRYPAGVDRLLELIGAETLLDSLRCVRAGGVVCMTGILGGKWLLDGFQPMVDIPNGVRLTSYSGGSGDITQAELQRYVSLIESGALRVSRGPTWRFEQLREAHGAMDENRANGKMVVVSGAE